jgi:hypothetical protein
MTRHRFDATSTITSPTQVDREAGVIRGCSAMQIGEALGHDCAVDATTIDLVVALGQAASAGIKARYTHPGMCADGLGTFLGRARNFRREGDKAVFDLHLDASSTRSPNGDLREYVLTLAETDPAACGFSVVIETDMVDPEYAPTSSTIAADQVEDLLPKDAPIDSSPLLRPTKLCAVDLVDEPAANLDGMFAAKSSSFDAAQAFVALDAARAHFGLSHADLSSFLARYFAARPDAPTAGAKPAATETPMALTPARLLELSQAHPLHHDLILTAFAAGTDEVAIMGQIRDAQTVALGAKADQLATELTATRAALATEQAARVSEVAALAAKLTALSAHLPSQDPGPGEVGIQSIPEAQVGSMTIQQVAAFRAGQLRVVPKPA